MQERIENELELDAEDMWIERAHGIGTLIIVRTIVVRFFCYMYKYEYEMNMNNMNAIGINWWNSIEIKNHLRKYFILYEDFSGETIELRKELFKKIKEIERKGKVWLSYL